MGVSKHGRCTIQQFILNVKHHFQDVSLVATIRRVRRFLNKLVNKVTLRNGLSEKINFFISVKNC